MVGEVLDSTQRPTHLSVASLLSPPKRTIVAVLSNGEINTFLMRTANDAIGDDHAFGPVSRDEVSNFFLDVQVSDYIRSPPSLQLRWLLSPLAYDAHCYLCGCPVVWPVVSRCSHW